MQKMRILLEADVEDGVAMKEVAEYLDVVLNLRQEGDTNPFEMAKTTDVAVLPS